MHGAYVVIELSEDVQITLTGVGVLGEGDAQHQDFGRPREDLGYTIEDGCQCRQRKV